MKAVFETQLLDFDEAVQAVRQALGQLGEVEELMNDGPRGVVLGVQTKGGTPIGLHINITP